MRSINDPPMLANNLTFGGNNNAVRVNAQADRPIGEGGRHTVAIALKVNKTGRRHTLAIFDKAIEGPGRRHEARHFTFPHFGDCSRLAAMRDFTP